MIVGAGPARKRSGCGQVPLLRFAWQAGITALCLCCTAHADAFNIDNWRSDVAHARALAENDPTRALQDAQRLQLILPDDAPPADKARVLNLLARTENYLAQSGTAEMHAKLALDMSRQHGDKAGQAEAQLNLVLSCINQGKIDEMIAMSADSVALLNSADRPDLLGEALLRMAMAYRRVGQLDDSVTMLMQAMEIARRNNNPVMLTFAHQGMATAYEQSGHYTEAHDHYLKMHEKAGAARSALLEAMAVHGLGVVHDHLGDRVEAENLLREAIARYRALRVPFALNFGMETLADLLHKQGQHAEALALRSEIIANYAKYSNHIGLWFAYINRSKSFQMVGRIAAAQTDAGKAYALAREIGFPFYMGESAKRMAALSGLAGDYRQAYRLSVEATDMADKLSIEKNGKRMVELSQRYESESKQREIKALTAELQQRDLQHRWLWTLFGGGVAMLAGLVYFLLHLRRSREAIRALNADLERRVQEAVAGFHQQSIYLRTLLDTLPSMVWMKDKDSRYLVVNQAIAKSCGSTVDGMIGKTDLELWPRELAEAYRADDALVMNARLVNVVEEAVADVSGDMWTETHKAPVLDEDGTVLGTVGFALDISRRKAAEAAREAALAEAERLARMRSEFLAQMSHELRTPLNGILGYAQILQRESNLSERQTTGLTVIRQSGEHLLALINDILDFAKIEAGKLVLNAGDIQLEKFLRTIAGIISVRAEQKRLSFELELGDGLPGAIRGDEQRLRQILLNLLSNAVKFTERGEVSLTVSVSPGAKLRFEVRDTGIGIPADRLDGIFRPFEQAGDRRRWVEGTGLGLAISRQFARMMGSDILVESRGGEGSTFWFELELPEAKTVPEPVRADGMVVGYQGPRKKILVVDDVTDNRGLLIELLGEIGFETVEAGNGREVIEMAVTHRPALILMDIAMPDMDGLEAARRLRQLAGLETVPIIAVSATASGSDEARCLAAGMNVFISKPVDMPQLLAQIGALLKLDWINSAPESISPVNDGEAAVTGKPADADESVPLAMPSRKHMEALHQLALQGNMSGVVQWAKRIAELDERYLPLSSHLRQLARSFESQVILMLAEEYLEGKRD